MSTEETSSAEEKGQKKSSGKTTVAFVAVAALAAVGGGVVANSLPGGDDSGEETTAEGGADGAQATTVSETEVAGENRGLDDVHQDDALVTTDWLADRLDEGDLHEQDIVLLDVSEDLPDSELTPYSEAHIPQAQ